MEGNFEVDYTPGGSVILYGKRKLHSLLQCGAREVEERGPWQARVQQVRM